MPVTANTGDLRWSWWQGGAHLVVGCANEGSVEAKFSISTLQAWLNLTGDPSS